MGTRLQLNLSWGIPFGALAKIGYRYYIVYASIAFCFPIMVFIFYPETMGQRLEKLERLFERDISIFEMVKHANRMAKWPEQHESDDELEGKQEMEHIEDSDEDSRGRQKTET